MTGQNLNRLQQSKQVNDMANDTDNTTTAPALTAAAGSALAAVLAERVKQNEKWGEQNHDPITWSAILTEECGEFAQAALHDKFGGHAAEGLREEAVQCAAVALQIVEFFDRQNNQHRRTVASEESTNKGD